MPCLVGPVDAEVEARHWASSGAMALTGLADGPPLVPAGSTASHLAQLAGVLADRTDRLGRAVAVDGPALLGERAAIAGFGRRGPVTVGGAGHMTAAADGWLAVNLARPDDLALVPAWLGEAVDPADWPAVRAAVAVRSVADLVARAALVGLPVAPIAVAGPAHDDRTQDDDRRIGASPATVTTKDRWSGTPGGLDGRGLVLDLSSLWAGPLCASLLGLAELAVVKIEHPGRPDGARRGPRRFFDLMNAGKQSLGLDLRRRDDRAVFDALLARAAVVVESARPRVWEHLGVDPAAAASNGTVWLSITGYGRTGAWSNRPAFGDDAAVAGGLVVGPGVAGVDAPPVFVADAVADPIGGLVGAVLVAGCLLAGRGAVVDLALRDAVAWVRGPTGAGVATASARPDLVAAPPRTRVPTGGAADLDAHGRALRQVAAR